jgi:hypothetical protein
MIYHDWPFKELLKTFFVGARTARQFMDKMAAVGYRLPAAATLERSNVPNCPTCGVGAILSQSRLMV